MRLNDLDDVLSDLSAAPCADSAWDIGQRYLGRLGFDISTYQFGDWDRDPSAPFRALANVKTSWSQEHFAKLSPQTEPLLAMACNSFDVSMMGEAFMPGFRSLPKNQRFYFDRLADSGWRSLLAFPLRLRGTGPFGGWGLGQKDCSRREFTNLFKANGAHARLAAFYVHEKMGPLAEPGSRCQLSPRQRDCLLWLSRGLRQGQIAEKLGVSLVTVEFHLRAARTKLRAKTNLEALSRAVFAGILSP
jgi:DNA-binding CsgD family transcriptional regulator